MNMADKTYLDNQTWHYFWHPVCTVAELEASDTGRGCLLRAQLLGTELVIARLESGVVAMNNRCPHRSAKLHLGWNRGDRVQCAYHGWCYDAQGTCVEIPAAPGGPIPKRARATCYDCEVRYGLVWVRLDGAADTQIPDHLVFDDPQFKCVLGPSYDWKTHSARRLENFTDLAHFPFVHPETLGKAGHVTYLIPDMRFEAEGKLRYHYAPPKGARNAMDSTGNLSPLASTDYTIQLPFGVTLDITLENGTRSVIWMWATPLDDVNCRSFWFACRNTDHEGPDQPHIDLQMQILEEDIDVVESQDPEQIPHPMEEIAVGPDKVSLAYRKCLYEMCHAKAEGADSLNAYLNRNEDNI
ncbi:MAG: Rieske 2Fe-2S domain-containing protein [Rhizobiaceae bacterium]|nr:Rieske 2Fe-2S domain-containing protein [Rhizobiaceae bacterium]